MDYCHNIVFDVYGTWKNDIEMPIQEVQSVGRVVLTSNVASMPIVHGDSVHYVNPLDIKDIRNGINRLINDENYREMLIQKGRENIKRFDPKHIAKQYTTLFDEILKKFH